VTVHICAAGVQDKRKPSKRRRHVLKRQAGVYGVNESYRCRGRRCRRMAVLWQNEKHGSF